MSEFADLMLFKFLQDSFVKDLLINKLDLTTVFNFAYNMEAIELKSVEFNSVVEREFVMPVFETIRTTGTEERIIPALERVMVNHEQSRYGRLAWVDVFMEIRLSTKVHDKRGPIEKITVQNLIEKLGGASTMTELRNKLEVLYPKSIVDAFFKEFRITTIEEFNRRGNLFLEFIYKTPPPYDPNDPQSARAFHVNVCVQFQPELKIAAALQTAKLCRSILENEKDFAVTFEGGEIKTPYIFIVIFPENVVVDNAIPGFTATQIKAEMKALFAVEKMLVHFITAP